MSVIVCLFLHLEKQGQLRLQVQRTTQLSTLSLADKVSISANFSRNVARRAHHHDAKH
jgi:hypothetical protein